MDKRIRKFEVGIFNQQVRDCMSIGEKHKHIRDDWADVHWVNIRALDRDGAKRKAESLHNPAMGFVIVDIVEIPEEV